MKRFGYDLVRTNISREDLGNSVLFYERLKPNIRFAPWRSGGGFERVFERVKPHTMVDKVRCFELWRFVEQSAKLGDGSLLEVGVWRGGTAALIAQRAIDCGVKDTVYLCDTFSGVVKASERDSWYRGREHADVSSTAVERFATAEMGLGNIEVLEGVFPDETGPFIADKRFRFCHIDVDVYQSARDVFEWVWPRMVGGGLVVFDDYGLRSCEGITYFVEEQLLRENAMVFGSISGHAVMTRIR